MTSAPRFARTANPVLTEADALADILLAPGFGKHMSDHLVSISYSAERGWHDAGVVPYAPLTLDPAAMVFHYGQAIFEGLKAYRQPDGSIAAFRPDANAQRFRNSARRLAMPELPDEYFLGALRELVDTDRTWVPAAGGEDALYLRPFLFATEAGLGVRPSTEYLYLLIASPAGAYFPGGVAPVSVWLSTEYVRAAPGGTGAAKFAGNYAASLLAQAQAANAGCDQVVWLDALERRHVEEMGGMNLFFVMREGSDADPAHLVTPELSGSLLPGITRDSLLTLARDQGMTVEERLVSTEEWEKKADTGEISEVFACGTAAVITPVGRVKHAGGEFTVADNETGPVTLRLRETLTGIQRGTAADPRGWMTTLVR